MRFAIGGFSANQSQPYAYNFTPDLEQTSINEGYFDITANRTKPPAEITQIISKTIRQRLKITVSQSLGSNKVISQIALQLNAAGLVEIGQIPVIPVDMLAIQVDGQAPNFGSSPTALMNSPRSRPASHRNHSAMNGLSCSK
jgi:hypothetical protein